MNRFQKRWGGLGEPGSRGPPLESPRLHAPFPLPPCLCPRGPPALARAIPLGVRPERRARPERTGGFSMESKETRSKSLCLRQQSAQELFLPKDQRAGIEQRKKERKGGKDGGSSLGGSLESDLPQVEHRGPPGCGLEAGSRGPEGFNVGSTCVEVQTTPPLPPFPPSPLPSASRHRRVQNPPVGPFICVQRSLVSQKAT